MRVAAPADFFDLFPDRVGGAVPGATIRGCGMEFVLDDAKADLVGEGIDVALRAAHFVDDNLIGHKIVATHFDLVASPAVSASQRHS